MKIKGNTVKAILFDLDGTLLPMDQDKFVHGYFKMLSKKLAPYGYQPEKLIDTIWKGTAAMVTNDGTRTNESAFWDVFAKAYGEDRLKDKPMFEEFYRCEFQNARSLCGFAPDAAEAVHTLKSMGLRVALATNPIFPSVATESRIRWAGLEPEDFEFYTVYDNIGLCKPNPKYYLEVAARLGLPPDQCMMVGNDVDEDMVAASSVGMKVFLITDCLINRGGKDIGSFPGGTFRTLLAYFS